MRTALAVVAVLMAGGLSGCAMSPNGCGGCNTGGLLRGGLARQSCGCGQDCSGGCQEGCDSGCADSGCSGNCGGDCGGSCGSSSCGCSTGFKRQIFPGPLSSMMKRTRGGNACDSCNSCDQPTLGMGDLAMFARGNGGNRGQMFSGRLRGCQTQGCGENGDVCNDCSLASRMRGRMDQLKNRERSGLLSGGWLASTEPVMNQTSGGAGGMMSSGGLLGNGKLLAGGGMQGRCGPGCLKCGGRGCGLRGRMDPAAQHPYGGQIPHTDGHLGANGPVSPTYAYPYYTTRGPRDFFIDNPPTIGR